MNTKVAISILICILCLIFGEINAQNDQKREFTLEECLQYAESNNFSLLSSDIDVASSELSLKQAKENIAPSVSASATQNVSFGNYECRLF